MLDQLYRNPIRGKYRGATALLVALVLLEFLESRRSISKAEVLSEKIYVEIGRRV